MARLDEPWDRLATLAAAGEGARADVATLLKFRDDADSFHPMYLFWDLYQPTLKNSEGTRSPAPELSKQDEGVVLEVLEILYRRHRLQYKPDADDSAVKKFLEAHDDGGPPDSMEFPDVLKNALVFIHVAAARALKLYQTDGFSDEVRTCLADVERTLDRLHRAGFEHKYAPGQAAPTRLEGIGIYHSTLAVSAISFVYLSRMCRGEGRYTDALHYLARAGELYEHALPTPMGIWQAWPLGIERFKPNAVPSDYGSDFDYFATGLRIPLRYFIELFESIKARRPSIDDWRAVADDCLSLADQSMCWRFDELDEIDRDEYLDRYGIEFEELEELEQAGDIHELLATHNARMRIPGDRGSRMNWGEFWHSAQVWATAQLSPSEYKKMREDDEKDAAEHRLRNYFFGRMWSVLSERSQGAIVNADMHVNSKERGRRSEAVLNELRIAVEEIYDKYIWQSLIAVGPDEWFPELEEFEARRDKISRRPHAFTPGLGDFLWACKRPFFRKFLEQRQIGGPEIQFLTQKLPARCQWLRCGRNYAEHSVGRPPSRVAVDDGFKSFLGIGQKGVLPELARIGRKIGRWSQPNSSRS